MSVGLSSRARWYEQVRNCLAPCSCRKAKACSSTLQQADRKIAGWRTDVEGCASPSPKTLTFQTVPHPRFFSCLPLPRDSKQFHSMIMCVPSPACPSLRHLPLAATTRTLRPSALSPVPTMKIERRGHRFIARAVCGHRPCVFTQPFIARDAHVAVLQLILFDK